jgi:hypothetical protein
VLAVEAVGGSFIDTIDVIRNGDLAARITPTLAPSPINADARALETILVLELGWGARNSDHCWTGRLAVTGGHIHAVEPRLRGPEIVSPLEGTEDRTGTGEIELEENGVRFSVVAAANPNNMTPATQAIAMRVSVSADAQIEAEFDGADLRIPVDRLLDGALSGNLGPIDSPAFRFHPLPRPSQWQWQGRVPLGTMTDGECVYVRLRQANGQHAWSSPLFCRSGGA